MNYKEIGTRIRKYRKLKNISQEELSNDINDACEIHFANYARPKDIYFVSEFRRTKVGKKDVRLLEENVKNNKILTKIKKPN